MGPGKVRNELQAHVLCRQTAVLGIGQRLCGRRQRLDGQVLVLCEAALQRVGDERIVGHGAEREHRLTVHEHVHDIEVVVGPFGSIDDRPALDADLSAVGHHLVVGSHRAYLHVEVHAHHVALLPFAGDGEVAVVGELSVSRLTVDRNGVAQALAVGVVIEVGGHRLPFHPSGDTYLHTEATGGVAVDLDGDVAVPRIACGLTESHLTACHVETGAVAQEEVDKHIAVLDGIDIAGQ